MPTKKNREDASDTYGNSTSRTVENAKMRNETPKGTKDKMPSVPDPDMPWIGGGAAQIQARKPITKI